MYAGPARQDIDFELDDQLGFRQKSEGEDEDVFENGPLSRGEDSFVRRRQQLLRQRLHRDQEQQQQQQLWDRYVLQQEEERHRQQRSFNLKASEEKTLRTLFESIKKGACFIVNKVTFTMNNSSTNICFQSSSCC